MPKKWPSRQLGICHSNMRHTVVTPCQINRGDSETERRRLEFAAPIKKTCIYATRSRRRNVVPGSGVSAGGGRYPVHSGGRRGEARRWGRAERGPGPRETDGGAVATRRRWQITLQVVHCDDTLRMTMESARSDNKKAFTTRAVEKTDGVLLCWHPVMHTWLFVMPSAGLRITYGKVSLCHNYLKLKCTKFDFGQ